MKNAFWIILWLCLLFRDADVFGIGGRRPRLKTILDHTVNECPGTMAIISGCFYLLVRIFIDPLPCLLVFTCKAYALRLKICLFAWKVWTNPFNPTESYSLMRSTSREWSDESSLPPLALSSQHTSFTSSCQEDHKC